MKADIIAEAVKGRRTRKVEPKAAAAAAEPAGDESPGKARNALMKALEGRFRDDEQSAFEFVQRLFPDACEGTSINYAKIPAAVCDHIIGQVSAASTAAKSADGHAGIGAKES